MRLPHVSDVTDCRLVVTRVGNRFGNRYHESRHYCSDHQVSALWPEASAWPHISASPGAWKSLGLALVSMEVHGP